jgi:hypothetical protein
MARDEVYCCSYAASWVQHSEYGADPQPALQLFEIVLVYGI